MKVLKVVNKQCLEATPTSICLTTIAYIDTMFVHSFIPIINKPTRITPTTVKAIYIILGEYYQMHRIMY